MADTSAGVTDTVDWWTRATTIANLVIAAAAVAGLCFTVSQLRAQQVQFDEERKQVAHTTSLDALWKLDAEWEFARMQTIRRAAAKDLAAKRDNTANIDEVLDFFDLVGLMVAQQVVDVDLVWHEFAYSLAPYARLTRLHVAEVRRANWSVWEDMAASSRSLMGSRPSTSSIR